MRLRQQARRCNHAGIALRIQLPTHPEAAKAGFVNEANLTRRRIGFQEIEQGDDVALNPNFFDDFA